MPDKSIIEEDPMCNNLITSQDKYSTYIYELHLHVFDGKSFDAFWNILELSIPFDKMQEHLCSF
jgi:hypothetical protein